MERYDLMGAPYASGDRAGILRTANAADEKNSGCTDAAITPSNLHNVLGYRKANTAYKGNEIVACPYHAEFMLKCTQAGTTSTGSLDTTSATLGKVFTDGGVKWEVIVLPIELGGTGNAVGNAVSANRLKYMPLKNGDNLDNCTDVNTLYSATGNEELINSPVISTTTAFVLEVMPWGVGNVRFFQRLTLMHYNVPKIFMRGRTGDGGFGEWIEVGVKTGQIVAFVGGVIPKGYLPCSGAAINRIMYCYLFAEIGIDFGEGDGVNTFNLPNLNNGSFLEGSDTAGAVKEAGLPNITGTFVSVYSGNPTSGAFYNVGGGGHTKQHSDYDGQNVGLDASLSNPIYGASDTVQPKSVTVRYCIKY